MRTKAQAFLGFFAETITQILLTAVTLTVLFSDQLVLTTKAGHGMPAFTGKCSITAYTTDQVRPRHRVPSAVFIVVPPNNCSFAPLAPSDAQSAFSRFYYHATQNIIARTQTNAFYINRTECLLLLCLPK
jgi:hypothetical protein